MSEKPTTTEEARAAPAALWSTGRRLIAHLEQSGTGAEKLFELEAIARHDPNLTAASVLDHLTSRIFSGSAAKARTWMAEHCPDELNMDVPKPDQPPADQPSGEEVTKPQDEATDGGEPEQTEDPEREEDDIERDAGLDADLAGDETDDGSEGGGAADLSDPDFDVAEDFESDPGSGGEDDPDEQLQPA